MPSIIFSAGRVVPRLVTLALLAALTQALLLAQVDTGAISGTVLDAVGASISGAVVEITNEATGFTAKLVTNEAGFYSAPALRPGEYRVSVTKEGFAPQSRPGVGLRVQDRLALDFRLGVGAVNEEVAVTADVRKNRTFFFAGWQSSRNLSAAPQIATVPTADMLAGKFGATKIYDPATTTANPGGGFVRAAFENNIIPQSRWDPVAAKLLTLFPKPNLPGSTNNFFYNPTQRVYNDQGDARVDHRFSDRDSLFIRFSATNGRNTLPGALPQPQIRPNPAGGLLPVSGVLRQHGRERRRSGDWR